MEGSVTSMVWVVVYVASPVGATLTYGDGAAAVSADQPGLPAIAGPPALMAKRVDLGVWPMPDNEMVRGVLVPEWLTINVADSGPPTLGANVTVRGIEVPGATVIGGVAPKLAEKSLALGPEKVVPLIVMLGSDDPPRLVSWTDWDDVEPVLVGENDSDDGDAPSWLGDPPGRISIAFTAGFSRTWANVMVMLGLGPPAEAVNDFTTPLRAPTSATVS